MSTKKLIFIIVALVAMTSLVMVGCTDRPEKSTNPVDVTSDLLDDITMETAWGFDCWTPPECFLDIDMLKGNAWGWTNGPYEPGTYYFDLWAAAGQCDLDNGYLVGFIMLDYYFDDDLQEWFAEVTYETYCDFTLEEVHVWLGDTQLPMQGPWFKAAPGQFPWGDEMYGMDLQYYQVIADGFDGSPLWFAGHAVVAGDFENYDCDATSICDDWVIYGVSFDDPTEVMANDLYEIDILDYSSVKILETQDAYNYPLPPDYPNGLAYDPDNQRLYFTVAGDPNTLRSHNLSDPILTVPQLAGVLDGLVAGDVPQYIACGAWWNGYYYYIPQHTCDLWKVEIDPVTRTIAEEIQVLENFCTEGTFTFGDIVAKNGTLYGFGRLNIDGGPIKFFTINLSSPEDSYQCYEPELNGTPLWFAPQLAFGANNVLYAHQTGPGMFYTVDIYNDGDLTEYGTLSGEWSDFTDLASGPRYPQPTQ